jgi:DNA-binding transcriptional LysR family regulator
LVAASEVARELGLRPAGLLRLTAPRVVVPILLESLIAPFCQAYPEVEVEIAASPDLVDIAAEGFDAGIQLGQFIEADMIAVRLKPSHPLTVVGSPDYLRRRQRPELINDLREHACLRMRRPNGSIAPWSFVNANEAVDVSFQGPSSPTTYPQCSARPSKDWALRKYPGRSLPVR